MLLRNTSRRLITINHVAKETNIETGEEITRRVSYRILPGDNPSVKVPDELAKNCVFTKGLIKSGDLIVDVTEDEESFIDEDTDVTKMKKNDLYEHVLKLGKKATKSMSKQELLDLLNDE